MEETPLEKKEIDALVRAVGGPAQARLLLQRGSVIMPAPSISTFQITVDYRRNLCLMIKDGHYDEVALEVAGGRFPVAESMRGSGTVSKTASLVCFNRRISSGEAHQRITDLTSEVPGKIEDLLAFFAAHSHRAKREKALLVALGTMPEVGCGSFQVPVVSCRDYTARLGFAPYCRIWDPTTFFLGVANHLR